MVTWSPCYALPVRCELHGPDEIELLARPVFALGNGEGEVECVWTWHTRRVDDGSWRSERDDGALLTARLAAELVAQIEFDCVRRVAYRHGQSDLFGLHGALLSRGERAIFLTGHKEAGKSTLGLALWQNGWQLGADDFCLVRVAGEGARVFPVLRRVSLRTSSRLLFGEEVWARLLALPSAYTMGDGLVCHPDELRPECAPSRLAPRRLDALFFVEGEADGPTCEPRRATDAMFALLAQTTHLGSEDDTAPNLDNWGAARPQLSAFTSAVRSFRLRRAPLREMIRAIDTVFSS